MVYLTLLGLGKLPGREDLVCTFFVFKILLKTAYENEICFLVYCYDNLFVGF